MRSSENEFFRSSGPLVFSAAENSCKFQKLDARVAMRAVHKLAKPPSPAEPLDDDELGFACLLLLSRNLSPSINDSRPTVPSDTKLLRNNSLRIIFRSS